MNLKDTGSPNWKRQFRGRGHRLGDGTEGAEPIPAVPVPPSPTRVVDTKAQEVFSTSSAQKKKTNGYILFIYFRKNQVERETGSKISAGLPAMMEMFNDDWNLLEEVDKEKWKNRAKERNGQETKPLSVGNDMYGRERNGQETKPLPVDDDWGYDNPLWANQYMVPNKLTPMDIELNEDLSMRKYVQQICAKRTKEISQMSFAIINFNTYKVSCFEYIPAELGIAVFSIVGGMTHEAYTLIDPKLGDKMNCHEVGLTQKKYGLPSPDFNYEDCLKLKTGGPSDYKNLFMKIQETLAKSNYACFALKSHIRFVDGCLNWIMKKAGDRLTFRVYPLEYLVSGLMSRNDLSGVGVNTMPEEVAARYRLSNSPHMLREDLACDWHKQKQFSDIVDRCALHTAKRQAYLALEHLTQRYGVECVDGIHAPVQLVSKPPYRFYTDEEDVRVGLTSLEIQDLRRAAKLLKEEVKKAAMAENLEGERAEEEQTEYAEEERAKEEQAN